MPGIIDSHTHYDAQITWDPFVNPSPALGVTTAIIGNCGFTIAPCKPADREITMRNLTQVEGMSLDVLRQGIDWDFETFPQYLQLLKRKGSAVNVAAYIGHSSVRTWVLGEQANKRAATADEIERMATIVREAMDSGAIGFASSTSPAHNGEGGLPMPSRLASDEEMMALIKAMGAKGKGIYMVTKGGQMPVSFLEDMSAQSGRPVMIAAVLHNSTTPQAVFKDLEAITQANARGRQVVGQVSCCPLTMDFTFESPYPVEGLQSWKPALGLSHDALLEKLSDTHFRNQVRAELATTATFRLFNNEWDKVHVVETSLPEHTHFEQRTVAEIAKEQHKDPLDFVLWKSAKPTEPDDAKWPSAYGVGRPGWHIECSAMGCELLGESFDIHGGGADLQFPHHENEIAQSQGASGKPMAQVWMHNGFINIDNEKMSKSLGNFFTIRDVLKVFEAETIRFFVVRSHYRSPLNYSDVHLNDARGALKRLYTALSLVKPDDVAIDWSNPFAHRFQAAMNEDFGTPEAVAVLFDLASEVNRSMSSQMAGLLKALGGVLGLLQDDPQRFLQAGSDVDESAIQAQIAARATAKATKNFAEADRIRQEITVLGNVVKDSPTGTTWERA